LKKSSFLHYVKRYFKSIQVKITVADVEFIRTYLSKEEQILFYRMRRFDQRHSLEVAYNCLSLGTLPPEIIKSRLVKAALLHDIGKCYLKCGLTSRVVYTLISYISPKAFKHYAYQKKTKKVLAKLAVLAQHAEIGAGMLSAITDDMELVEVVRYHNSEPRQPESYLLPLIREADKSV